MTLLHASTATTLSAAARRRFEAAHGQAFLTSDWLRTLMIHFAVPPAVLQPLVPFELDLRYGSAYVSLVAFSMRDMRINSGRRWVNWLTAPLAHHGFLNVRTYVRCGGETGIYFLAEWLPNALAVALGPRLFGLPYRLGRLSYQHVHERGELSGRVEAAADSRRLNYEGQLSCAAPFEASEAGSLDEFLMERYTAFTEHRGVRRLFRIWHEPWPQVPAEVRLVDASLLRTTGAWCDHAQLIGANYSPGVLGVWISRPQCINGPACGHTSFTRSLP
ncbi:MAG: DUF2071 domain-containing protein [Phycisphaeraceae bacterium]